LNCSGIDNNAIYLDFSSQNTAKKGVEKLSLLLYTQSGYLSGYTFNTSAMNLVVLQLQI
jgi:hypothetical protein